MISVPPPTEFFDAKWGRFKHPLEWAVAKGMPIDDGVIIRTSIGELQLRCVIARAERVSDERIRHFLQRHIDAGATVLSVKLGQNSGYLLEYSIEDRYFREWALASHGTLLSALYSCELSSKGQEDDTLESILHSIELTEISPSIASGSITDQSKRQTPKDSHASKRDRFPFNVRCALVDDRVVISPVGSINDPDIEAAAIFFAEFLQPLIWGGYDRVLFDISNCPRLSRTGVGIIGYASHICRNNRAHLTNYIGEITKTVEVETNSLSANMVDLSLHYGNLVQAPFYYLSYDDLLRDLSFESPFQSSTGELMPNEFVGSQMLAGNLRKFVISTQPDGDLRVLPYVRRGKVKGITAESLEDAERIRYLIDALAKRSHSYFSRDVARLTALLNRSDARESDFQEFFERHPRFLLRDKYQSVKAQVVLELDEGRSMRPVLMLEPVAGSFWDVLDLKLPKEDLLLREVNRDRLYAEIYRGVVQLRRYSDYFNDPSHRRMVEQRYGIKCYKPNLILVVGRRRDLAAAESMRDAERDFTDVEITTYEEIRDRAAARIFL